MPRSGAQAARPPFAWLAELAGLAMALYLRLVARTVRIRGDVTDGHVVLALWHEFNLAGFVVAVARRGHLRHASFSTRGFRGVVITEMLRRSGTDVRILPLPDESHRGEARTLAVRLAELAREGYSPVVTPDGPFGPYRLAKPGALIVARASGLPIQPWAIAASPAIRLTRRWDRHVVPLPFSRIRVVEGERLSVAPRDRIGSTITELQRVMDEAAAQVDRA